MNREDYGTCWTNDAEDVREFSGPTADFAGKPDDQRGFRVVHDNSTRVLRGVPWSAQSTFMPGVACVTSAPKDRSVLLGFRLAREGE
jgi:hypothetical protein